MQIEPTRQGEPGTPLQSDTIRDDQAVAEFPEFPGHLAQEAAVYEPRLHPRAKDGRWTAKSGGSSGGRVSSEKPLRPEQKAKIRSILAGIAPESARRQGEQRRAVDEAGAGKRVRPHPAVEGEKEIRRSRPRLPGTENLDLDMVADRVIGERAAGESAARLAAFGQLQRDLAAPPPRRRRFPRQ